MNYFEYPAFQVSQRQKCLRFVRYESKIKRLYFMDIKTQQKHLSYRLCPQNESRLVEIIEKIKEYSWLGVGLNRQKQIVSLQILAANLLPDKQRFDEVLNFNSEKKPGEPSFETIQHWNRFLFLVRQFFNRKKFLEVNTPTLVSCPGTEPFLEPFRTEFIQNNKFKKYFLPTSPELHLKKLVARGWGEVYEIRTCFRNGEVSDRHQPEFWMLEWYRPGHGLEQIKKDCVDLIRYLQKMGIGKKINYKINQTSMRELFYKHLQFELNPTTTADDLLNFIDKNKIHISSAMRDEKDFDDLFYYLFVDQIENKIQTQNITFVQDYPPSQAALARLNAEGWGDRFELYWRGFEIANAFHELNDPFLQRKRAEEDLKRKKEKGFSEISLDEDFFAHLEAGMPPTSGIALGLERLFLALTGRQSLFELRHFPVN